MNTPTTPLGAALQRALLGGVLLFGYTTLTTYVALPESAQDWDRALIIGGIAGMGYLLQRAGVEGGYDQKRDSTRPPDVQPADVGVPPRGPDTGAAPAAINADFRRPSVMDPDGDGRPNL